MNHPKADEFAERILLLFADERGVYKRTYQKRFEGFDCQVISILKNICTNSKFLSFHDVGVSSGCTALDFFKKIVQEFPHIQYIASDYNPKVYILEKGSTRVTISNTGKVLEIMSPPFVFNKMKRDSFRHYPLNHLIRFLIELFIVRPLMDKYQQGSIKTKTILLFAPQVLQLAQQDERLRLIQHDLLIPLERPVHIIRAMNILNTSYFSESEFLIVLRNIYEGLKAKGLLITGSNQESGSLVHGGIYRKNANGFKKLFQSGNGSPIEDLILTFRV